MTHRTIKFRPQNEADAEAIAERLRSLTGSTLEVRSAGSFTVVQVVEAWTATPQEICITFGPGVVETLGETLLARELIEAAGKSASH